MDEILGLDAVDLSARIGARGLGVAEVMAAVLDRIEAVNPAVNAIVSLRARDDLMAEARAADSGPRRGWLHGIPMAVKDLAATRGIRTTWGSPLFADHVPDTDEMLPRRLRAAGAILIGKTNTPEFGLGSHTFNPVHGATHNPYDLTRTPGGSSGGAAAALAARMLHVADGSDMMGSLRNPAAFCNVYGYRPTWGLVPSDPVGDTFLHQLATDGPMGRSPRDIAALLTTLAGPDAHLPYALPNADFAAGLEGDPKGRRIGWLGDWGGAYAGEPGIAALCETALEVFEALGCVVEPVAPPFSAAAIWDSWITLRSWAVAARQEAVFADPSRRAMLKPAMIWEIERGLALSAIEVHRASVVRSEWFARLADLFQTYDALVLPSAQVWPFPTDWVHPQSINGRSMDSYHRWMEVVVPVSLAGVPCLNLPVGFGETGLPMGMQIFGARGADQAILQLGQAYHRVTDWPGQRPPVLWPSAAGGGAELVQNAGAETVDRL